MRMLSSKKRRRSNRPPFPVGTVVVLSARTDTALAAMTNNLVKHLIQYPDSKLADVAYTLQAGRKQFSHRRMLWAATRTMC